MRIFPFREISVLPRQAAFTVIYRTSDTRMPVAQIVLGVTLGILAVGVTYYLLRPRRPRPQKAESDFDV